MHHHRRLPGPRRLLHAKEILQTRSHPRRFVERPALLPPTNLSGLRPRQRPFRGHPRRARRGRPVHRPSSRRSAG
jgi:hypothetical protein